MPLSDGINYGKVNNYQVGLATTSALAADATVRVTLVRVPPVGT
jgi:hypothetical protein